jgi:hypothetical protein
VSAAALVLPPPAAAPPAAAAAAPAGVRVLECTPALDAAARSVTFEARMRPARRSVTMALRFTLQARTDGALRWRRVAAPGFGVWLRSAPGVRRYTYARTVRNLPVPATYRTVVRFRWLDGAGRVLARARAVSAACAQPDLRPDLVARRLDVLPAPDPETRRYAILVRNTGATGAAASVLAVDLAAGPHVTAPVPGLAAGESRTVAVTAPACAPGGVVSATVDARDEVDEADEGGNVITVICPP